MSRALALGGKPRQQDRQIHRGIARGWTAQDQLLNGVIVGFEIVSGNQRAHAVAEQIEGEPRVARLNHGGDRIKVLGHRAAVLGVKIPQVRRVPHTFPVPPVVVDHSGIPVLGQECHEILIPLFVLRHSMGNLDHALHACVWGKDFHGQGQPIDSGWNGLDLWGACYSGSCHICSSENGKVLPAVQAADELSLGGKSSLG